MCVCVLVCVRACVRACGTYMSVHTYVSMCVCFRQTCSYMHTVGASLELTCTFMSVPSMCVCGM